MAKRWNRLETWLALIAVAVGAVLTFIFGLHAYVTTTATTWHPDPQAVPSVAGAEATPDWTAAVAHGRQVARTALAEQNLPGVSVAVGVDGALVWTEGFGFADLDTREVVAPDTRFRIGTASVMLTSAAIGLLVEQDRMTLEAPIRTYVPEFPAKDAPITVRQLMGHLSGVRNDGGDEGPLLSAHCERPVEALDAFAERPLLFAPGTEYRYSSYGWIVLSAAIESVTDMPLATFMRQQIFDPLGMDATRPDAATERGRDTAAFYFPRYGADPRYGLHPMREIDYSCYAGASVFLSTPTDLVRFGMAINEGTLLQPSTVRRLQTSQRLPSGRDTEYGLGWDIEPVTLAGEQTRWVGHDGESLGGTVATLMTFPERGLVVAVTSNIAYADTAAVALRIAEGFATRPGAAPTR